VDHMTPSENPRRQTHPTTFPRSGHHGPNLATLDQLRGLRRPRLRSPEARRHQVPVDCAAC
jgi:hypothetical protein